MGSETSLSRRMCG